MHRSMLLIGAVLALAVASPAGATFPGENGALVFSGLDWSAPATARSGYLNLGH